MKPATQRVQPFPTRRTDGAGGGSGDGGMMEARVTRLEADLGELKTDMKAVRDRLSRIEGEIARLPGYPGLFVICGTLVATVRLMLRFF